MPSYTEHNEGKTATNEDNNKARTNKGRERERERKNKLTGVNLLKRQSYIGRKKKEGQKEKIKEECLQRAQLNT